MVYFFADEIFVQILSQGQYINSNSAISFPSLESSSLTSCKFSDSSFFLVSTAGKKLFFDISLIFLAIVGSVTILNGQYVGVISVRVRFTLCTYCLISDCK